MMMGVERISKKEFYLNGAFANSRLFRRMRGGSWQYFWNHRI